MDRKDAEFLAKLLYKQAITDEGFQHPRRYEDLLDIVLANGASVVHCPDAPPRLEGVHMGDTLYIQCEPDTGEAVMIRRLAHEWAHYLRRQTSLFSRTVNFYNLGDRRKTRDVEEWIARSFERLF